VSKRIPREKVDPVGRRADERGEREDPGLTLGGSGENVQPAITEAGLDAARRRSADDVLFSFNRQGRPDNPYGARAVADRVEPLRCFYQFGNCSGPLSRRASSTA